jgi:hypothetical protein
LNNLNTLTKNFGVTFYDELIESENCYQDSKNWVIIEDIKGGEIGEGIQKIILFEGCSMQLDKKSSFTPIANTDKKAHPHANAPVIVSGTYGKGKVVCMGDATIFTEQGLGSMCNNAEAHFRLLWNTLRWLTPIKGLSSNLVVTKSSEVLLPIAINKISKLEAQNQELKATINEQINTIAPLNNKLDEINSTIIPIKNSLTNLTSESRGKRFLDIISDLLLMLASLALVVMLNNEFVNSPKSVIGIILGLTIFAAILVKVFRLPKNK